MIIYNKSTFLANDSHEKIWILERYKIFQPKRRGKGIMILDFILPLSRLNLFFFFPQQ